jgi:hypothetical protein
MMNPDNSVKSCKSCEATIKIEKVVELLEYEQT